MSTRRPSAALLAAIGEVVIITGNDLKEYLFEKGQVKKACNLYNWDIRQLVAVVQGNNRTRTHDVLRGLTMRGAVDPTALEKLRALRGVPLPKPDSGIRPIGIYTYVCTNGRSPAAGLLHCGAVTALIIEQNFYHLNKALRSKEIQNEEG
jgi:hypothetical protein